MKNKIAGLALFLTAIAGAYQSTYASEICPRVKVGEPMFDYEDILSSGNVSEDEFPSDEGVLRDGGVVLSSGRSESPMMVLKNMVGGWEERFNSPFMQETVSGEWEIYAEKSFARGDGLSLETAFEIETPEQLAYLSVLTNFADKTEKRPFYYYKLVKDIDLDTHFWDTIGIKDNSFGGYFDGNGCTISNLNIHKEKISGQGLFGYVQEGSVIKNVTLNNFFISADFYVGGIIGQGQNVIVDNCKAMNGAVVGDYNFVGGIIGDATGSSISNCFVESVSVSGSFLVGVVCGNQDNITQINCGDYLSSASQTEEFDIA